VLRTRNDQPSLWESVLPEVCLRLLAELERVDAWLDESGSRAFRAHHASLGRPSLFAGGDVHQVDVPRSGTGWATDAAEVGDLDPWRRFCRIDIDGQVPHPTTLMKITTRVVRTRCWR
jgi:IS5 family transposase